MFIMVFGGLCGLHISVAGNGGGSGIIFRGMCVKPGRRSTQGGGWGARGPRRRPARPACPVFSQEKTGNEPRKAPATCL